MSKKGYNIMDDFIWGLLTEHVPREKPETEWEETKGVRSKRMSLNVRIQFKSQIT